MNPDAATYEALSRIMALGGDVPQALDLLDKGEKSDPAYVPIYIDRGDILMAVDRNSGSLRGISKSAFARPSKSLGSEGDNSLAMPRV